MSGTPIIDAGTVEVLAELERTGAVDSTSLTLTDTTMTYERWEAIGRFLGSLDRRTRWYIGDWLIFGESLFGEEAAQGVEATTRERYSEAERVTGLDHGTMMNVRSICARVPKSRRRSELGFWIHSEVAPLEPDDQSMWLQAAIDNGWSRAKLREEIRGPRQVLPAPPVEVDNPIPVEGETIVRIDQWVEDAARAVIDRAVPNEAGDFIVPGAVMHALAAVLGTKQ